MRLGVLEVESLHGVFAKFAGVPWCVLGARARTRLS